MLTISTDDAPRPLKMRHNPDRRTQEDRRCSPVDMRLRVGLWYQYHRATRAGEFDALARNEYNRGKVQQALLPEMLKYEFAQSDGTGYVQPAGALTSALGHLWSHPELGCNAAGETLAVYTINAIAEYLCHSYRVASTDRRKTERRAVGA